MQALDQDQVVALMKESLAEKINTRCQKLAVQLEQYRYGPGPGSGDGDGDGASDADGGMVDIGPLITVRVQKHCNSENPHHRTHPLF